MHPSYWDTPEFNVSRAMKPDVVIFMFGTNDAFEWGPQINDTTAPHCGSDCGNSRLSFQEDYTQFISLYQNLTTVGGEKPRVVASIPPRKPTGRTQRFETRWAPHMNRCRCCRSPARGIPHKSVQHS